MTEIILRITRLLHGTEHQRTDDHFLRTSFHLFQDFLERPRMDFISLAFYDDAEIRDEFEKLSEFLLFRIFVNTIQERHFHPVEVLRDRLVGSEHELLDHLLVTERVLRTISPVEPSSLTSTCASLKSKSIAPRASLRFLSICASSSASRSIGYTSSNMLINAWSSSTSILLTASYVILRSEWMTLWKISWFTTFPFRSISIRQLIVRRSSCGFSEQMPFDRRWGIIGMTRSTR